MLKIISALFDRCLFTLTFILGLQLPEFIQQYSQRLSGHLNEALSQLSEYQLIADRHFDGNLTSMINKYLINSEQSIKETANIISHTSTRVTDLQSHLFNIQEAEYVKRVYYFVTQFDQSMAQATIEQYQLAIPLSLPALITGALFALCIVIIIHLFIRTFKLIFRITFKKSATIDLNNKVQKKIKLAPIKNVEEKALKVSPRIGDISNLS